MWSLTPGCALVLMQVDLGWGVPASEDFVHTGLFQPPRWGLPRVSFLCGFEVIHCWAWHRGGRWSPPGPSLRARRVQGCCFGVEVRLSVLSRNGSLPLAVLLRMHSRSEVHLSIDQNLQQRGSQFLELTPCSWLHRSRSPTLLSSGRAPPLCQHVENATFPVVLGGPGGVFPEELRPRCQLQGDRLLLCQFPLPSCRPRPMAFPEGKQRSGRSQGKTPGRAAGGRLEAVGPRRCPAPWHSSRPARLVHRRAHPEAKGVAAGICGELGLQRPGCSWSCRGFWNVQTAELGASWSIS